MNVCIEVKNESRCRGKSEIQIPQFSVSNSMPILSVAFQISEPRGSIMPATRSLRGAPGPGSISHLANHLSHPHNPSHWIPHQTLICLQGRKTSFFWTIILVATKALLCIEGNRLLRREPLYVMVAATHSSSVIWFAGQA